MTMPSGESAGTPTSAYAGSWRLAKSLGVGIGAASYGEGGPDEGQLYPVVGIFYGDLEMPSGLWNGLIDQNTTINVPTDQLTLENALSYLADKYIASNVWVTIDIAAGTYTRTSRLTITHPCAQRIVIKGAVLSDKALLSIVSSSGSSGNWTIVLQLDSVAGIAAGDYVIIRNVSGGSLPEYIAGVWPVSAVDSGTNRITVTTTHLGSSAPSGSVTGTVKTLKTKLQFNGASGLYVCDCKLGLLNQLAIIGNGGSNTFGIQADLGNGTIQLGEDVGVRGFTVGALASDAANLVANGCAFSGNGYGVYSIHGSTVYAASAICSGNSNTGAIVLGGGLLYGESGIFTGNIYGVQCQLNGTARVHSSKISGNTTGIYAYGHGYAHASGATFSNNTTNTWPALNTEGNKGALIDDGT